ncbi:MAG: ribosome assembly factor SBDS [Candidatus Thermoplasmatota archaeon]|nr:ribosome assembly factor SBDS [Candidatus Thermoplasmatota archaeon]
MGKKDYQKEHTKTLLDEHVIGRMDSHGERFEVIIQPDTVEEFRSGEEIDLLENMPVEKVFSDAHKGEEAPNHLVEKVFETNEIEEIAESILKEGEVQITTEQRNKRQKQKRKEIVNRIAQNSYNPQTDAPHPPQRIENAMSEAEIHIDPFQPVSKQMDQVVDEIRELLPLSFEKKSFAITVRGDMQGKIYGLLKNLGSIKDEEWLNDGRWQGVLKIPAGKQDEMFEKINKVTKGEAEIEELDR